MTVWAKEREVVCTVVLPIAIEVMNCERHVACLVVTLLPPTARTLLAVRVDHVPTKVLGKHLIADQTGLASFFPVPDKFLVLVFRLAAIAAVLCLGPLDRLAAVEAIGTRLERHRHWKFLCRRYTSRIDSIFGLI
jgi:hypothetical protein